MVTDYRQNDTERYHFVMPDLMTSVDGGNALGLQEQSMPGIQLRTAPKAVDIAC